MSTLDWITCPDCGVHRQKRYDPYKHPDKIVKCGKCSAKGNGNGRKETHKSFIHSSGYILIWIGKGDFYFPMASKRAPSNNYGYVTEHRLIMARHIGRCLQTFENVHHKNGIKDDNRLENLVITASNSEHIVNHSKGYRDGYRQGLVDGRVKQIQLLKEEIRRLQNG